MSVWTGLLLDRWDWNVRKHKLLSTDSSVFIIIITYRDVKQTVVVSLSIYLPSGSDTSTLASASGPAGI